MKVLVTGCGGLLGQKLVKLLHSDGNLQVIATARARPTTLPAGISFHALDITNPDQVNDVITKTKPDVLINTAAATNVDWCEQNVDACFLANTTAVHYLVQSCEKNNVHLVQLSTDFIFNGSKELLTETDLPYPVNHYGQSKLEAERLIQASALSWCIVRTVLVYGVVADLSRLNIVLWVKKSLEEGKPINVVNDQLRTPTLAEDLAMGCYLAIKKRVNGIYHISGGELMTPYDMASKTADFFGLDRSLITATNSLTFRQPARRPLKTGFTIEKAKRELGYLPHSFTEGLTIVASQLTA